MLNGHSQFIAQENIRKKQSLNTSKIDIVFKSFLKTTSYYKYILHQQSISTIKGSFTFNITLTTLFRNSITIIKRMNTFALCP